MLLRAIDEIKVLPDRQRKDPADKHIKDLAESIERDGLINPITVTEDGTLVAGFCRLSAIGLLHAAGKSFVYNRTTVPLGFVPCLLSSSEEPRVLFRIELEENLRRKNLSPVESAKALASLHALFSEGDPKWNKTKTAEKLVEREVHDDTETARVMLARSLLIAEYSDDEAIQAAKTESEAYGLARKKSQATLMAALGLMLKEEEPEGGYCKLINSDYRNVELPENFFDCILVDPPYGMGADNFGDQTMALDHTYKDDEVAFISALQFLTAPELIRSCKAKMHLYLFLDIRRFDSAKKFLEGAGYYVWSTPLIWVKNVSHLPQPDLGPKRCYEAILFATRGTKPVYKHGDDVLRFNAERDKMHAAQKPVELYQELLSWSCSAGDAVLDFCCGSGTIFAAVQGKSITAWGIERDSEMCNIARTRI